jgi:hypothetical protein
VREPVRAGTQIAGIKVVIPGEHRIKFRAL